MTALVERLRAATGGDRELDALIEVEARRQEAYRVGLNDEQRAKWRAGTNGVVTDGSTSYFAYTFTASVDAALALVERLLGHAARVDLSIEIGAVHHACSISLGEHEEPFIAENCRTPAIAILLALLTALSEPNHE